MKSNSIEAGTDSTVVTVKPFTSPKLKAIQEESLRLLERRARQQAQQAELEAKYRAEQLALLEEKERLLAKKEFNLRDFMIEQGRRRRLRETIQNILGR